MKRKTDNIEFFDDPEFGKFLRKELPQAPRDEWFVRKTMNRLPPKQARIFSTSEIFTFIIAVVFMIVCGIFVGRSISHSSVWVTADTVSCLAFVASWIFIIWNLMARLFRAN